MLSIRFGNSDERGALAVFTTVFAAEKEAVRRRATVKISDARAGLSGTVSAEGDKGIAEVQAGHATSVSSHFSSSKNPFRSASNRASRFSTGTEQPRRPH